jgi:RNA polymerase sigma-70 factor (ECF subfamily)
VSYISEGGIDHRMTAGTARELEARFDEFVRQNLDRARRLAWRIIGGTDVAAAEDVTQEALLRAYRALPGFRQEAHLGTWFYRILVRQAQNHRRWRAVREYWSGTSEEEPADHWDAGDPFVRSRVQKALQQLTAPQRDAFVLIHLEGFTTTEAAEMLGRRPGTLKTHLKRAIANLRKELGDLRP